MGLSHAMLMSVIDRRTQRVFIQFTLITQVKISIYMTFLSK